MSKIISFLLGILSTLAALLPMYYPKSDLMGMYQKLWQQIHVHYFCDEASQICLFSERQIASNPQVRPLVNQDDVALPIAIEETDTPETLDEFTQHASKKADPIPPLQPEIAPDVKVTNDPQLFQFHSPFSSQATASAVAKKLGELTSLPVGVSATQEGFVLNITYQTPEQLQAFKQRFANLISSGE